MNKFLFEKGLNDKAYDGPAQAGADALRKRLNAEISRHQWFKLYGPGLRAKNVTWEFDFDSDTFKFSCGNKHCRITEITLISNIADNPTHTATYLLQSLGCA